MTDTKVRQPVYLVLAVVGLVGTGYFNLQWFTADHFDHSVEGFFEAAFANSASSSVSVDLLVAFVAGAVFILVEGARLGMRHLWLYVVLWTVTAFAFALPLFLWARERHLAATAAAD